MKYAFAILAFASIINTGEAMKITTFEDPPKKAEEPKKAKAPKKAAGEASEGGITASSSKSDSREILPADVDSKSEAWIRSMPESNVTKKVVIQPDNTEPIREFEPPKTEA